MPPKVDKKTRAPRKKTTRACNHCHKAHMTCDETRPCKRCVSRGLEATCVDAPRKKKKYLMDVPDGLEAPPTSGLESIGPNSLSTTIEQPRGPARSILSTADNKDHASYELPTQFDLPSTSHYGTIQLPHQPLQQQDPDDAFKHMNKDNLLHQSHSNRSKFMSNAANNEYSILSHILKQEDLDSFGVSSQGIPFSPHSNELNSENHVTHTLRQVSNRSTSSSTPNITQHDIYNTLNKGDKSINQYMLGFIQDQVVTYPEVMKTIHGNKILNPDQIDDSISLSFTIAVSSTQVNTPLNTSGTNPNSNAQDSNWGLRFTEPEDIYAKINKPFSYTPGFHALIQYLKGRFNRTDLIKMAKSMASYRPSFIACTNTLKEEDLIFMEQCFQRTLLEYDKYISISGTPTIVWRRTGQISYVSEEFLILTGWKKDDLLNKTTFIVELMDDSSVIEYFNLFSTIAFGDFKAATMGGCTLLTPDNTNLRTTCIWTLKRDVFGIPMMIIGNFLPII